MRKFAKADVDNLFWFWANPLTGQIYHLDGTHTMAAIDPEGQIGLNPEEFGGHDGIKVDDSRVFEAAFRRGWVRSAYVNDVEGGPQLALHGADKEIVMTTLELLLAEGLDVGNIGMVGHFDGFDYDGPIDEIG